MLFTFLVAVLGATTTEAYPVRRAIDSTAPQGTNPITVASAIYLGNQTSDNTCVHRDLGFTGRIAENWYAVYGDTDYCAAGLTNPAEDNVAVFNGMVRDSVTLMTEDPLKVHDLWLNTDTPVPHPKQFVPFNSSWGEDNTWGFGGTSICETDADAEEAVVFYLRNDNLGGLQGSGVGRVNVIDGVPVVVERYGENGYWWDTTTGPRYGDVLAYSDLWSDYIYAVGGAPTSALGYTNSDYAYMARVNKSQAFDLSQYEYWNGPQQGWSSTPLTTFSSETALFWGCGQGQIFWNAHYQIYMFVHMTQAGDQVMLRTAQAIEGPWSTDVSVYETGATGIGLAYAGIAHPYLDETGKTITISYTVTPNKIQVIQLTFE